MADQAARLDGVAKVTGRARYGRDRYMDDQLFVGFLRCPWGEGRLESIDEAAATAVPGVLEIQIERREARYHGRRVGYVVAESKLALRRGLRAARPRWVRQPSVVSIEQAMGDEPRISLEGRRAIADAEHVLEAVYTTPTVTHCSLETHGLVVDHRGDEATVYASTQGTSATAQGMGEPLGLANNRFEVVCEYIGGGFGSKLNGAGPEGLVAGRVAAKYQRPVSLFLDRDEEQIDTGNRPASRSHVQVGFNADGTIVGGWIRTFGSTGVGRSGGGVNFPSGRYDFGTMDSGRTEGVSINDDPPRPFRAPGHPQGAFAEELMLDEVAGVAGVDPLELRLKLETSDDRRDMLRLAAEGIGWSRRRPNGTQGGTLRTGYGLGTAEWGRYPARAEAEVLIHRDGSVEVRTGTQDIGTGMRTVAGIVAAEAIGVGLESVEVRIGSSKLPVGPGSGGSMTSHNTVPVIMQAADRARGELMRVVAGRVGGEPDDYSMRDGRIVRDGEDVMTFGEACSIMAGESVIGRSRQDRGDSSARDTYGGEGHSHGAQAVRATVDVETGEVRVDQVIAVQACGRVVCRKTAESQIIGGVIQGLSYALFEEKRLDRRTGAMVNPNLEMYRILGPADMPHIVPILWTRGQTGVRSLGEPPIVPTAGAVACAVLNAIGRPVRSLPLSPDAVLAAVSRRQEVRS